MSDARTADFLEGSGAPLPTDWKAPDLTAEQIARAAAGRAAFDQNALRTAAALTSVRNVPYQAIRAATNAETLERSNLTARMPIMTQGSGAWNFAGLDLGLLPVAVAVVVPLIATAATGGLAAPSVAASWSKLKGGIENTAHAVASVDSYGDVKGLVGEVKAMQTAFKVPDLVQDELVAAHVAADQLLSNPNVTNAHQVIANTHALAFAGDIDAQRGAVILAKVAGARNTGRVPFGQPLLPVHTPEQAALVAGVIPRTVYTLTAQDMLSVTDVRQKWWKRLIHWLEDLL